MGMDDKRDEKKLHKQRLSGFVKKMRTNLKLKHKIYPFSSLFFVLFLINFTTRRDRSETDLERETFLRSEYKLWFGSLKETFHIPDRSRLISFSYLDNLLKMLQFIIKANILDILHHHASIFLHFTWYETHQ